MKKKLFSLALALALCLGLTVPAFAAELKIVEIPLTVEEYEGTEYFTDDFHDGLARLFVYNAGSGTPTGVGFIDKTGAVVVPAKYDDAHVFSNGFARVQKNNKWSFIDKTGKEICPLQYSNAGDFSEGFAAVVKNGRIGFINQTGEEVIPFAYDEASAFSQGLAAVKKSGKWGYIDQTGKEVIPFQYDGAYRFWDGLAPVKQNGKWGFIDKTGAVVVDFQYDDTDSFSQGLARVKQNGKWGYVDQTGDLAIPCRFETAGYFSEGLAAVTVNGKRGYIDKTGRVVIPGKYAIAAPFSEGFAAVQATVYGGPWGYIDKTGKEVVPPTKYTENGAEYQFDYANYLVPPSFSDGYAHIRRWFTGVETDFIYFAITVDAEVSDWAREQVDSAAVKGLMPDGLGDDFREKITRAEFAALAVKLYEAMSGQEAPAPGGSPFSDTSAAAVIQANALGIVDGVGGGRFAPDDLVTREQAALMLSRVYTKLGGTIPEVAATTFADNGSVSGWARDAVAFMSDKEIVNGVGDNKFDPKGSASIEQAMVIALRMLENLK